MGEDARSGGLVLEFRCPKCGGTSESDLLREDSRCTTCGGIGTLSTEVGGAILDLVRHHFLALLRDALDGR